MTTIKSPQDIKSMQEGGKIARTAIDTAVGQTRAGMTTLEINKIAEKIIRDAGAEPCFKGYNGFPFATCINVNSGIVHGLPGSYKVKKGDVVSIDLGVAFKEFNTDVSETFEVDDNKQTGFLETGKRALQLALEACAIGNSIGDISSTIQETVERAGYSVSVDLAGHGIGKSIHEDPYVPCFGRARKGQKLVEGMTLAIEVIYQKGRPELSLGKDGWTLYTKDGSLSGLFEKSVALTRQGVLVLT